MCAGLTLCVLIFCIITHSLHLQVVLRVIGLALVLSHPLECVQPVLQHLMCAARPKKVQTPPCGIAMEQQRLLSVSSLHLLACCQQATTVCSVCCYRPCLSVRRYIVSPYYHCNKQMLQTEHDMWIRMMNQTSDSVWQLAFTK